MAYLKLDPEDMMSVAEMSDASPLLSPGSPCDPIANHLLALHGTCSYRSETLSDKGFWA